MRLFLPKESRSIIGFTLIELMIAISVIAILSTIAISVYSQSQKLARDSRRKADLKQIQVALNLYYQDFKSYPAPANWQYSTNSTASPWIAALTTNYISVLPIDPSGNGGDPWTGAKGYAYCGSSTCQSSCPASLSGQYYTLATSLENANDPESIGKKDMLWCDGVGIQSRAAASTYILTSQ